ncbi:MAG: hypothetical protein DELT_00704 [Desulfovibrio sp.]
MRKSLCIFTLPTISTAGAIFCLAWLLCVNGCATRPVESVAVFEPPVAGAGPGAAQGVWIFRHAVTLELPDAGVTLPFTGVMRLDVPGRELRAVALGGMGLTFLDMRVTGTGYDVRFIHPSLSRFPGAAEHAAAALRMLWLGGPRRGAIAANASVTAGEPVAGWAETLVVTGENFTLKVTLVEAQPETKP